MTNTKNKIEASLLTPEDDFHRIHTYYKGSPCHPDGKRLLVVRFRKLGYGEVCLVDMESGSEEVIGESEEGFNFHTGPGYFCDGGNKVLYTVNRNKMALYDIQSRKTFRFDGSMDHYSGRLRDRFIEVDRDYPKEEQHRMGIYIRNIDGSGKRLLANVGDLLSANPLCGELIKSGLLFRLGAEICPDQKKARLSLITRGGFGLVKDFYTCPLDGEARLCFHGRLGNHPSWHHNNRDILAFVKPWSTLLGNLHEYIEGEDFRFGLLARYNTETREMKVVCDYKIRGACHVSCSPTTPHAVLDCFKETAENMHVEILLFNEPSERMEKIHEEDWIPPESETRQRLIREKSSKEKLYGVNPHPTFSPNGGKIVFNSCVGGVARLRGIDLSKIIA